MMRSVANAYGAATDQVNVTKFKEWGEKLPVEMKTSLYNDVSWNWALKDMQMETAKMISEEATRYAKNEVSAPTQKKPETITTSQWDKSRKNTYGMFADTYGFIMYKLGKYQEAYPYLKDAAIDVQQAKNAEYNERYALILEKVETPAKIKAALEPMVREGKSTEKVKEILRNAYVKSNASGNVSAYIDELVKEADAKKLEEIRKTMLKYEAAGFVLKNMEGTPVSLASLKGKVVVVDFWATWCGPCKASFPAMQKMVDKYRNDKNVEFLFVDTWENGDDRLKNVKQFIADNKYSFHVLMDDPKKDNADEFTVVSNYKVDGIPTKFVIDGEGNVRFKSVGYQGSVDALMTELTSMIELARTNK
jgi:thiol-disulfide isomerase/thioredoxin